MKKNYRGICLLVLSFILLSSFEPFFFGSGLTETKQFNLIVDTNFDPLPTGSQPYELAFANLNFDTPLNFNTVPNSNNIVVGQRDGKVFWFIDDENTAQKSLVIDLSLEVGGKIWDGGFLGLSLHPEFGSGQNKNFAYVYYTTQSTDTTLESPLSFSCGLERFHGNYLVLERFEIEPLSMQFVANSRVTLIKRRMFNTTHRGGGMQFGDDGFLYISTGDQAAYINAQQIAENLDGGVLRLDVDMDLSRSHVPLRKLGVNDVGENDEFSGFYYTIPNDNPFVDYSGSVFEEYYSIGHRNPHRLTKDSQTGVFYIGEVGEDSHEEINVLSAGKNYGWPLYEGFAGPKLSCLPQLYNDMDHTRPLVSFPRSEANAIIGGYVYRGNNMPELKGKYLCADYGVGSEIWAVDINTGNYELLGNFTPTNIVSFGQDFDGELYLLKQGDNVNLYKLKSSSDLHSAPTTLSATGVFVGDVANLNVREGFIPYDLIDSFYSDGAVKKRWMAIPNNGSHNTSEEKIDFSANGNWNFPVGSVLVKHFEYPIDDNNPTVTRKLETRFSIKDAEGEFYFLTYRWNESQTEAYLVEEGLDENITINTVNGDFRQISWHYPSEGECLSCHNPSSGGTLGPRTKNLNKDYDYTDLGGTVGNQLVTLSALGILNENISDEEVSQFVTHTSMYDLNSNLEDRARSYLDLNCAYCHNPNTNNRANFDLRLERTLSQTGLLTAGVNEPLNIDIDEKILYPGNALKSILYHRTASVQPGTMMPPLAKNQVDEKGVELLEEWINSLVPTVQAPVSGIYRLVNVETGNTLQTISNGSENSINIVHKGYEKEDWQHFQFENAYAGYYQFRIVHSNKYLDVAGFGPLTNSNVWQYEGNNSDAQLWEVLSAGDDSFYIVNSRTSKYLKALEDGNIIVAENDGSAQVKWRFNDTESIVNSSEILYRLNAAGPSVASTDGGPDWSAGAVSNGMYVGDGYTVTSGNVGGTNPFLDYALRDASIPTWMDSSTYGSLFSNERWDPGSSPEMSYLFTVPDGLYTVNLFVANNCSCTDGPGERMYSISIEGTLVETGLDLSSRYGHRVGGMLSYQTEVVDGELDITFLHGTENTLVNAIEIRSSGDVVPVGPVPLAITAVEDMSVMEGSNTVFDLMSSGGDLTAVPVYTATGLPIGLSVDVATGRISGRPSEGSSAGGPSNDGTYPITVGVERGGETATTGFVLSVLPVPPAGAYHYRLNAAGPSVASTDGGPDWSAGAVS
ncbi:PQQ-dependent sugar dehydrogenase, partial [Maribacter dokdonensis]|uniref:PQQ-dependent sugar dehydrogenase n=1 Tax=Maribacter dokdonensis TaxID=320912 RepID=UPI002732F37A